MILTADSEIALRTNRRRANEGWNTVFLGSNRFTRKESDPVPEPGALYPVAFLVEKEAGAVVRPHFHHAEQFQVVVGGSGSFGTHDAAAVTVHYTDPYSAYGPIRASDDGIQWFTLRNAWDPGARYMPTYRDELRAARARHQHREATAAPQPALSEAELRRIAQAECAPVMAMTADGMGAWRYRLPPGASVRGPDPREGGGQFWLVLAGRLAADGSAPMPVNSCVFVAPDAGALIARAGGEGAEALCMQFPVTARH